MVHGSREVGIFSSSTFGVFAPVPALRMSSSGARSEERRVGKECRARGAGGQAEDGIRDVAVTGVQTCALPICTLGQVDRLLAALVAADVETVDLHRGGLLKDGPRITRGGDLLQLDLRGVRAGTRLADVEQRR